MPGCNLLLDGLDESGSGGFGVKADDEANFTPHLSALMLIVLTALLYYLFV
jgi:hypothetical protein